MTHSARNVRVSSTVAARRRGRSEAINVSSNNTAASANTSG